MPRPKRPRCVLSGPIISEFKPEGFEQKGETILSLEEFEAIRHGGDAAWTRTPWPWKTTWPVGSGETKLNPLGISSWNTLLP